MFVGAANVTNLLLQELREHSVHMKRPSAPTQKPNTQAHVSDVSTQHTHSLSRAAANAAV